MSGAVSLSDLVEVSIGHPESGMVNFRALRALLHGLLHHLHLQDSTTQWEPHPVQEGRETASALLDLCDPGASPLTDLWQLLQLRGKVEANGDGVSQAMILLQEVKGEIQELQASRKSLLEEVRLIKEHVAQLSIKNLQHKIDALEQCCHRVERLDAALAELQEKMKAYPNPDEFAQVVTWDVLQEALVSNDHPLNMLPCPSRPSHSPDGECGHTQPTRQTQYNIGSGANCYTETVEALRHVGQLKHKHNWLEERVSNLKRDKAELSQIQQLKEHLTHMAEQGMPESLRVQLNHLKAEVDSLVSEKMKTSAVVNELQVALLQLGTESEKLRHITNHLSEEQSRRQSGIDDLYKSVEMLEEKKADMDFVEMKVDSKADKHTVEEKVSHVQFDTMSAQVTSMFQELLAKINEQEHNWRNMTELISAEMASKLNRHELEPMKRQLEECWKSTLPRVQAPPITQLDDAAVIKKQLVAHLHCISCDRPVDMVTPGPLSQLIPIPCVPGFPSHKPKRPYGLYVLEQQCSDRTPNREYGYLTLPRSCGGKHTLSQLSDQPQNLIIMSPTEGPRSSIKEEEVYVQGKDHNIYRGRVNAQQRRNPEPRLPSLFSKDGASSTENSGQSLYTIGSGSWRSKAKVITESDRARAGSPVRSQSPRVPLRHSAKSSHIRPMSSSPRLAQTSTPEQHNSREPEGRLEIQLSVSKEDQRKLF